MKYSRSIKDLTFIHICQILHVLYCYYTGIVVGSLEILGNPTGLVRSIGTGVADLVKLPYSGLTQGPGAFMSGVSSGMSSFVRNISSGKYSRDYKWFLHFVNGYIPLHV